MFCHSRSSLITCAFLFLLFSLTASAQTTTFTYQGKLTDSGVPANSVYDFTFKLYSADVGGTQVPPSNGDVLKDDVTVTNGIFTVSLDFGQSPFSGPTQAYFLEIWVRPGSQTGAYTQLLPRQPITSSPYAVQTIRAQTAVLADNANQLGGVNASSYIQNSDSRLTDARTPTSGSTDYIQNRTIVSAAQTGTSFYVDGSGRLGGQLKADSVTVGAGAPGAGSSGRLSADIVQSNNGYVIGTTTMLRSTASETSVFLGRQTGSSNTGSSNSFVGFGAGQSSTGSFNSFFGTDSGKVTSSINNSFFGNQSGTQNTSGTNNSFFGHQAGDANINGSNNTFIGYESGVGATSLFNATAIGAQATVSQSNSLVLGNNANVGIGTSSPEQKLHVNGNTEILSTGLGGGFKFRDRGSVSPADDWVWYSNGNIARFFRSGTGDLITVATNGNVGIGVGNPAFPIDVHTATFDRAGFFHNSRTNGFNYGAYGVSDGVGAAQNIGLRGDASGATDFNIGAYTFATGNNAYGLYVGAGTKNWVNPHPADPTRSIVYVTLEGAESGAYWRGKGRIVNGKATVVLPEHYQLATSTEYDITVTVTPRSVRSKGLAVVSSSNHQFKVKELLNGRGNYDFDYIVIGVRRGYETWKPIKNVLDYVPFYGNRSQMDETKTSTQEFYDQQSDGLRKIFISNGLLNPDGTVNRQTFRKHGWRIVERK